MVCFAFLRAAFGVMAKRFLQLQPDGLPATFTDIGELRSWYALQTAAKQV